MCMVLWSEILGVLEEVEQIGEGHERHLMHVWDVFCTLERGTCCLCCLWSYPIMWCYSVKVRRDSDGCGLSLI